MNNKLKIIETPDYILAVSDGAKAGDFVLTYPDLEVIQVNQSTCIMYDEKIIAYKRKGNAPELKGVLEILDEDDIEKLADENAKIIANALNDANFNVYRLAFDCFIEGYRATKKYSEDDLRKCFYDAKTPSYEDFGDYIKSLKQPTPKYFIAETIKGGEYLAGEVGGNEIWAEYPTELKTTTINGKEYLVGKFIYE